MKIAVCLSGLVKGQVHRNISRLKDRFPYDFFYSTWTKNQEDIEWFPQIDNCVLCDEPVMHYHPIKDAPELYTLKLKGIKKSLEVSDNVMNQVDPNYTKRVPDHTKQILAHAHLLDSLPEEYDMIIRARYDSYVSSQIDFLPYVERSYDNNIAMGFGTRGTRWGWLDRVVQIPKRHPDGKDESISQDWSCYLQDPIIMHPRKIFDTSYARKLHEEKKLLPAEVGWWQVLSQPYGNGESHESYYGGVQVERFLHQTRYIENSNRVVFDKNFVPIPTRFK